jgi:hypothetical protein
VNQHNYRESEWHRKISSVDLSGEHPRYLVDGGRDRTSEATILNIPLGAKIIGGSTSHDEVHRRLKRTRRVCGERSFAAVLFHSGGQFCHRASAGAGGRCVHNKPRKPEECLEHQGGVCCHDDRTAINVHGCLGEVTLNRTTRVHLCKPRVDDVSATVAAHQVLHRDQDVCDVEPAVSIDVTHRIGRPNPRITVAICLLSTLQVVLRLTPLAPIARN